MGEDLSDEDIDRLIGLAGEAAVERLFDSPAIIATILRFVPIDVAAAVLNGLPAPLKRDVALAVVTTDRDSMGILERAEEHLVGAMREARRRAERTPAAAGVADLAELLWRVDRTTEAVILAALEQVSPALAVEVSNHMVQFEIVAQLDLDAIHALLKEVEIFTLSRALVGADEAIAQRVYDGMSARAADMLREDIAVMRAPSQAQIDHARKAIAHALLRLASAGHIELPQR